MKNLAANFSMLSIFLMIATIAEAQNPGFLIEGTGYAAQQRITDTQSGNSLVL